MTVREYLIYCSDCNEYSLLGRYLHKEGCFQGEYSLLYNRRINNAELLCRFLLKHLQHHITTYRDRTKEYEKVVKNGTRFMDKDIDRFVEQEKARDKTRSDQFKMDRDLGRLQLNVLQKMLEEDIEEIASIPTQDSAEAQFLLGKEEGMKQALDILIDLMEKTNTVYS